MSPASHLVVADFPGIGRQREGSNFWLLVQDYKITLSRCVGAGWECFGSLLHTVRHCSLETVLVHLSLIGLSVVDLLVTVLAQVTSKNMVYKLKIIGKWVAESGHTPGV